MGQVLTKPFEKMGARVVVRPNRPWGNVIEDDSVTLDVRTDSKGEYFDIALGKAAKAEMFVLDTQPEDRHLLMMIKVPDPNKKGVTTNQKFLCGHDERHWFTAAVGNSVTTVRTAKESLKPSAILDRECAVGLRSTEKVSRKNAAWKRQGEWFFVPVDLNPPKNLIRKNEPFNRGRGKMHYAQEAYRSGGKTVYVKGEQILTPDEFRKVSEDWGMGKRADKMRGGWSQMMEGATLYVRGRITHSDHATLELDGWHQVHMNNEKSSEIGGRVKMVFLD